MEADALIAKLKADGSEKDICDLDLVYREYKSILANLSAKERGSFSLDVLCIFGRNLGKVPSWSSAIDSRALLTVSIDCVRETRPLARADRVKALACIYHLHKHVVKQNTQIPPELVLKISYMPFEGDVDNLFKEHFKTYWNILVDRMIYIDKLKTRKIIINKLLTKLTEDLQKVVHIYVCVDFCSQILVYLIKRLHSLYTDVSPADLDRTFEKIFYSLSKKDDLQSFKTLGEKDILDMYVKFNECLYLLAENSSKTKFKECILNRVVWIFINMLGHSPAVLHCLHTFYLNSFCSLLNENIDLVIAENIMNSLLLTCESAEKSGYNKAMNATYPFLNQFLRLYIEHSVANFERNQSMKVFTVTVQKSCLALMLFLMMKLKNCKQLLKCENCKVQSGLHDSLRLSFMVKHFVSTCLAQKMDLTKILPTYFKVVLNQYQVLNELCSLGCANYEKCYKKLQGDTHNTATLLNKTVNHEYPIKLFDIYLKNEIKHFRNDVELKNISRALFNKSICELDFRLYDTALRDAYLSLVFAYPEAMSSDKHMSLVMDIKAKASKVKNDENASEASVDEENLVEFQLTTVLDVIMKAVEDNYYGNLKPFLCNLKISALLRHEFSMYVKLWPSIVPVAGVWRSLCYLTKNKDMKWLTAKDTNIQDILYGVVLETPTAVRTIQSEYYKKIVAELLENFEKKPPACAQLQVVQATLLFMKADHDMAEASQRYGWRITEPTVDPDGVQALRTLRDESEAMRCAERAVHLWTRVAASINTVPTTASTRHALQTAQVWVQHFLHAYRLPLGLQLAHVCCLLAKHVQDKQAYLRNAGTILYYADRPSPAATRMVTSASQWWGELVGQRASMETALVFLCDCAIHYTRTGSTRAASKLVRLAQARVLVAAEKHKDVNLDLAVGRLLEAQGALCGGRRGALAAASGAQRHYLTVANTANKWCCRRLRSATVKHHSCRAGATAARLCRALLAWRRARSAAGAALPLAAALPQAVLHAAITNTHAVDDAQIKIEARLKHILGLLSNDTPPHHQMEKSKAEAVSPKQDIETMLENLTFHQKQTCPSSPRLSVPGFQTPRFLKHGSLCECHNCRIPECVILACQICGLEASTYYRAKEFEIARNYFDGTLRCLSLVESKLKDIMKGFREKFEAYIVDIVDRSCDAEFKVMKLEILIEAVYFELTQNESGTADEKILQIHEILQESPEIDPYLRNEVFNMTTTSALVRREQKVTGETGLEVEMETLTISSSVEPPKTPEIKAEKPPKLPRLVAKDEELHNTKRRVIKLNLDDGNSDERPPPRRTSKRALKIPPPEIVEPVLECLTPCVRKPRILITQPSQEAAFDFPTTQVELKSSKLLTIPTESLNFDIQTPKPKAQLKVPKPGEIAAQGKLSEESIFEFATPKPKVERKKPALTNLSEELFDFPTPRPKTATKTSKNASVFDFATPKPKIHVEALKPIEDSAFDFTTPKPKIEVKPDFFTPLETPSEQFFTPLTVKTYSKRSLRKNVVKNLESEFSTPKTEMDKENSSIAENSSSDIASKPKRWSRTEKLTAKVERNSPVTEISTEKVEKISQLVENSNKISAKPKSRSKTAVSTMTVENKPKTKTKKVETGSLKDLKDKRSLKRATSPGKLLHEEKPEQYRSSRLRKPVRFSIDDCDEEK